MEKAKIDYSKYSFRHEEDLSVKAGALSQIYAVLNELVEKEGVGFTMSTDARYEYVHKETSELAKPNTKKETLDKDYRKVFSMDRTMESSPTIQVTETGKKIFSLMRIIDAVRIENLDSGKGTLISTLKQEMEERQNRLQETLRNQQQELNTAAADLSARPQKSVEEGDSEPTAPTKKATKGRPKKAQKA